MEWQTLMRLEHGFRREYGKTTNLAKTKEYITNLLKARFPFIYISTWEEGRVTELIQEIASDEEKSKR